MRTLKLSVQLSAASFLALLLPFLFFSVCGFAVPHSIEMLAVYGVYLLPVVILLLLIYVSAVGIRGFAAGLRSRSTARIAVAFSFLVIVALIVAGIFRVLWRK